MPTGCTLVATLRDLLRSATGKPAPVKGGHRADEGGAAATLQGGPFQKQRPLRGTVRVTAGRGTDEARHTAPRRAKEREE